MLFEQVAQAFRCEWSPASLAFGSSETPPRLQEAPFDIEDWS